MEDQLIKFKLYSEEYVNKEAINHNFILRMMYGCSYPFSYIFYKLKLSPNLLTWLSIALCAIACYGLLIQSIETFIVAWSLSVLFDFCDGTVARMTNNIRKNLLRFDHYSDLCKFSAVILFLAIYYESPYFWILSFLCSSMYLFYTILDHDVVLQVIKRVSPDIKNENKSSRLRDNIKVIKLITDNDLLFNLLKGMMPIFIINGHTLLIFIFMPLSINFAYFALVYLIILTFIGINLRLSMLRSSLKR